MLIQILRPAILLIFICLNLFLNANPIRLNWVGEKPSTKTGVSWGVPFKKGQFKPAQQFILKDENGKEVPQQSWPMAFWPDGSLKWLAFAAVVPSSDHFFIEPVKKSVLQSRGIVAEQKSGVINIDNGLFKCVIPQKGNTLYQKISIGEKVISENARLVCTLENREKAAARIITFNDYESRIDNAELEQSGTVRAVVKLTGVHYSKEKKRELLPFTVRLYFFTGIPEIRMVHSFVFDGDQEHDFIKSLGMVFDVPLREQHHNRHIRFSGQNGGLWSESVKPLSGRYPFVFKGDRSLPRKQFAGEALPDIDSTDMAALTHFNNFPSWDDYELTQLNPNGFSISKRTNAQSAWVHADDGKRSEGHVMLCDVTGGLAVTLKNFWQSYPASLEVCKARSDKAQLKVWLWSPEAEAMDLRHYDTIPHDLLSTYEDIQPGLSTPYGVARTSELSIFVLDKVPSKNETVAMSQRGANAPQLLCTPEYLHAVKAFGTWSLPDFSNQTRKNIENQLDSSIFYYQKSIDERHWYGFWNYGDVMHSYDPNRHAWKYDVGGFAWANTELAPGNWLWYSFLRTGRADIYQMAMAMSRHTAEVDVYHLGEMKGLGTRHNVSHWGCGAKEARIGQAAWKRFQYYLTTDERSGDLMREALDVENALMKYEPLRIAQPREKFPFSGPTRLRWGPDWLALAGNWMTEWERTGDVKCRNKIITGLDGLAALPDNLFTGTGGLSYDPETGKIWYDGIAGRTNQNHLSTIMGGYEILMELFEMVDHKPFRKKFTEYCRLYSMPANDPERNDDNRKLGDIGFRTPRLTAFAARELNDDKLAARAWSEFLGNRQRDHYGVKMLSGPAVLNPVHENPFVGTNGTSQWALNAIILPELIGDKIPDAGEMKVKNDFLSISKSERKLLFSDDMKSHYSKNWFADGEKLQLKNSRKGLLFRAGVTPASDADHSVLWTKQSFEGDIWVEFNYIRRDEATKYVNIIYLFVEGSGVGAYEKDISKWSGLRKVPAMKWYFEHMNALHISFAGFENDNYLPEADYVRARRYLPERGKGLQGTEVMPEYLRTGFFKPNEPHRISIVRKGNDVYMKVKNTTRERIFHWDISNFPELKSGRIGLRLMGSRISEFSDFSVYQL